MSWSKQALFNTLGENLDAGALDIAVELRDWLVSRGAIYRGGRARTPSGRYGLPITDDYPTFILFYTWDPDYGRRDRIAIGLMNLAKRLPEERVQRFREDLMENEAFAAKLDKIDPPYNRYPEFDIDGVLTAPGALPTLQSAIDRLMR